MKSIWQRAKKHYLFATAMCLALSFFCTSCSSSITAAAMRDGSVKVSCNASFGEAFMRVMRQMNGTAESAPFLTNDDCADMQKKLNAAGAGNASVLAADDSISVSGNVQNANSNAELFVRTGCVSLVQTTGKQRLTLALNRGTLGALYGALDEEVQAYLDLSMAGVFNGESMTAADWLFALETVYGKAFAAEAKKAVVTVKLSIEGKGTGDMTVKTFTFPLSSIMTGQNVLCEAEG